MSSIKETIRRTYDAVALVALVNLAVLLGGVTFILASGKLNAERVQKIAAVMRGENLVVQEEEPAVEESGAEESAALDNHVSTAAERLKLPTDLEIIRREAERIREELRQRTALNNSIMLRITNERDRFHKEQEAAEKRKEAETRARNSKGFRKQIDLLESISPKVAVQQLLGMSDPDEAAEVLLAMKTRKAKRIIEAAKGDDEARRMMAIMERVRRVSPERSNELDAS